MNAQIGQLEESELRLGGRYSLGNMRSNNGDRLLQLCAEERLFLASTNFRRGVKQLSTWRSPNSKYWSQIDHIAISYRWRGCFQNCRSFWNTHLESDHALVRARISLKFPTYHSNKPRVFKVNKLVETKAHHTYQEPLGTTLPAVSAISSSEVWLTINQAIKSVAETACDQEPVRQRSHWISGKSVDLLDKRRLIPMGKKCRTARKEVNRELKHS